jgi:hypothetical protein
MTPRSIPAKAAAIPLGDMRPDLKARLKDQFHEVDRLKHLSLQTEVTYWEWTVHSLKLIVS